MDIKVEKIKQKKPVKMGKVMIEAGFSKSTARVPKQLTESKGWQQLLAKVDDSAILDKLNAIAMDIKDKRACLQAIDILLKLKDKYPAQKSKIVGLFDTISGLEKKD